MDSKATDRRTLEAARAVFFLKGGKVTVCPPALSRYEANATLPRDGVFVRYIAAR